MNAIHPYAAHLLVAPVLLPLLTAAVMIAMGERQRWIKSLLNLVSVGISLALAVLLLARVASSPTPEAFGVYLPGNWPVPFGISLVLDRLSARPRSASSTTRNSAVVAKPMTMAVSTRDCGSGSV